MMMLFGIMTYARLESFRSFAFVQSDFKTYMEKTERQYVNNEAVKKYRTTVATKRGQQDKEDQAKNPASSKLSFELFVDKEAREKHPEEHEQLRSVAIALMNFLYGNQPFFQNLTNNRPDFLREILDALERGTESLSKKDKLQKVKGIATVDLRDEVLNEAFTKMLKGTSKKLIRMRESPFKPENGYYSLLDFITIQPDKLRMRVYLASPQLLMALYGNPDVVGQILSDRNQLYQQVKNNSLTPAEATKQFESSFRGGAGAPASLIDFGVSGTNPRNYN